MSQHRECGEVEHLYRSKGIGKLQAASYEGHEKVVELLLSKEADVNAQGGKYGTALQAAPSHDCLDKDLTHFAPRLLLQRGDRTKGTMDAQELDDCTKA